MKWYEPLIWEEFIEYFSEPSTSYFDIIDGNRVCDEMFLNYYDVVHGLTMAYNAMKFKYQRHVPKECVSDYTYKAYNHFIECSPNVDSIKKWDSSFCSFFGHSKVREGELTADQLAWCIMYPFWGRWGSDFVNNIEPKNGKLANAVLTLLDKHNKEK